MFSLEPYLKNKLADVHVLKLSACFSVSLRILCMHAATYKSRRLIYVLLFGLIYFSDSQVHIDGLQVT